MSSPRLTKRAGLEPTLWIATALCVITLGLTYFEGGQEGICSNVTDFANEHQDAAGWRKEYSLWPPGRTCVALKADGSVLAQRTYPEPEDWLLALALFAAPIGLWAVWPRLRRQSSGAPRRHERQAHRRPVTRYTAPAGPVASQQNGPLRRASDGSTFTPA